ncbi:hypothetical protein P7C73_g2472, partial [Tremellales sp. Uapishka_1]
MDAPASPSGAIGSPWSGYSEHGFDHLDLPASPAPPTWRPSENAESSTSGSISPPLPSVGGMATPLVLGVALVDFNHLVDGAESRGGDRFTAHLRSDKGSLESRYQSILCPMRFHADANTQGLLYEPGNESGGEERGRSDLHGDESTRADTQVPTQDADHAEDADAAEEDVVVWLSRRDAWHISILTGIPHAWSIVESQGVWSARTGLQSDSHTAHLTADKRQGVSTPLHGTASVDPLQITISEWQADLDAALHLFGEGAFFQPYLPLQQIDMLQAKSWLAGTTNQIVTQQKDCRYDLLVNIEHTSFDFSDPKLERMVALTPADRKWMDDVVKTVEDTWVTHEAEKPSQLSFKGSDDDLRSRFEEYICAALSSIKYSEFVAKGKAQDISIVGMGARGFHYIRGEHKLMQGRWVAGDSNILQDFGEGWVNAFRATPAFAIWSSCTDPALFDLCEPRHPCDGKVSTVSDIGLRLQEGLYDLHLDQQLAPTREALTSALQVGSSTIFRAFDGVRTEVASRLRDREREKEEAPASTPAPTPAAASAEPMKSPVQMADIKATLGGIGSFFGQRVASFQGKKENNRGLKTLSLSPNLKTANLNGNGTTKIKDRGKMTASPPRENGSKAGSTASTSPPPSHSHSRYTSSDSGSGSGFSFASANSPRASGPSPEALKTTAQLIQSGKVKNIVILTGAGISTSAGIPDFRSPKTGLYANLQKLKLPFPEAVFELNYFKSNPKPFWTLAKELYPGKHLPTATHYFFALLDKHRLLRRVFSQNIDTLETLSGLDEKRIVEAHGSFHTSHCLTCRKAISSAYVLRSGVRKGEVVYCDDADCRGLVKPDIVFFGEGLPEKFFKSLQVRSGKRGELGIRR